MSGGSFDYLYSKDPEEMFNLYNIDMLERMERFLRREGKISMAEEIGSYSFALKRMRNRAVDLHIQYAPLLEAAEFWRDDDIGTEKLDEIWSDYENRMIRNE